MSAVRVRFVRSGGFANVRLTAEVDDPDEAGRVADAVRRCAARPAQGAVRDGFSYEFTLVSREEEAETVELADGQLDAALRPMVRDLVERSRPTR